MRTQWVCAMGFIAVLSQAQTDSMFVEFSDGTLVSYSVPAIEEITFDSNISGIDVRIAEGIVESFVVRQNYPNPFNPTTTVEYDIAKAGHVTVRIFDINGRLIRVAEDGWKEPGSHRSHWNGRNDDGEVVASGLYFCHVQYGQLTQVRKALLLK